MGHMSPWGPHWDSGGNAFFASNRFEDVVVGLRRAEQLLRASAAHLSFRTLLPRGPWLSWQSLALIQLPAGHRGLHKSWNHEA